MASDAVRGRKLALAALLVAAVAAIVLLPVREWLEAAIAGVERLGPWGPLALVGLYIVSCVLLVPGSLLTLAAGALFGLGTGIVTVFVGATAGATAAFLVGRHLARDWVAAKVAGNPRFAAIDAAVAREGLRIVLLTRLSPVFPFSLLNYAYGLTSVSLRDYLLGSIGMLPGTVLYVYLGSAAGAAASTAASAATSAQPDGSSTGERVLFWGGLAVALLVTTYVTRIARAALRESVDDPAAGSAP